MKTILLITSNEKKLQEFSEFFANYGVKVEMLNTKDSIEDYYIKNINHEFFAIIKEETTLIKDGVKITRKELKDLDVVETYSTIELRYKQGFHNNTIINSDKIKEEQTFIKNMKSLPGGKHTVKVWRHQSPITFSFTK